MIAVRADNHNKPRWKPLRFSQGRKEESYTSKASAVDGEEIPVYNADNPKAYQFSGSRIKRGLYRTKDGHLVNSDLNGSLNIGRKCKHEGFAGVSRGSLTAPRRINLLKLERQCG